MVEEELFWLAVSPGDGAGEMVVVGVGETSRVGGGLFWRRLRVIRLPVSPNPSRPPRKIAIRNSFIMMSKL